MFLEGSESITHVLREKEMKLESLLAERKKQGFWGGITESIIQSMKSSEAEHLLKTMNQVELELASISPDLFFSDYTKASIRQPHPYVAARILAAIQLVNSSIKLEEAEILKNHTVDSKEYKKFLEAKAQIHTLRLDSALAVFDMDKLGESLPKA